MLAQRFALIHQRILRHSLFRPTNLSHNGGRISATSRANIQHKLTPIECLLGGGAGGNRSNNSVLILGILIQIEEGQYYLEDQTGQVPVVFQDSVVIDGFFVTEQCILLVEGRFHDDMFLIDRLGHPLQETREISLQNIQQQVSHPLYASRKISNEINSSSFVVLSDVYLDQPRVLQQLESLFATYENFAIPRIPCFVIMGNFCSPTSHQPQQQNQQYSQNSVGQGRTVSAIEELVTLITKFPRLAQYAHFCIVPGPNDYGVLGCSHLHVLPLPPLDKVMKSSISSISGSKNVAHLNYGSNPCRIRFSGQEIVVFRYDLLHLMQQNQVLLQRNATSTDVDMTIDNDSNHHRQPHCRLVKTILDQGHLIPVSNVPLYWNYDSSLQLYPLPDALILGGDGPSSPYHEIYGGCQVIHPGSFVPTSSANTTSTGSSYAVFSPDGNSDADDELLDSATEKSTVEFLQVGNID